MPRTTSSGFAAVIDEIAREIDREGITQITGPQVLDLKRRMIGSLIHRRRDLAMTQSQAAALAGLGQAELSKIERGRKSPTLQTYCMLAVALRFDAVTGRPAEPPPNMAH